MAVAALIIGVVSPSADAQPAKFQKKTSIGDAHRLDVKTVARQHQATKVTPGFMRDDKVVTAIVELKGGTLLDAEQAARTRGRSFNAVVASRQMSARQDAISKTFRSVGATVTGRYQRVLNGVKVRVNLRAVPVLANLPGVVGVSLTHTVSRPDNATSGAYMGVPQTWTDTGKDGTGVKIGIIDTGIDYYHLDFGGTGAAAFLADDPTIIEPTTFPTAKVAGGTDFVGNSYDADSITPANTIPHPDPDPVDCAGHGTHVAGTAAGQGVTTAPATYTGPYNNTLDPNNFNVFPGGAPNATLYAYKVFGCDGTVTNDIIVDAIERAVTDKVNVINMSLGAPFGTGNAVDEKAVNNAAKSGVVMVISAGNEGPSAYMVGGPGTADRALSVAAIDVAQPNILTFSTDAGPVLNLSNDVPPTAPISAAVDYVGLGCDDADYSAASGKIVVADRGVCDRVFRAIAGKAHGALAVILVNNGPGYPPFEGHIDTVDIPFFGALPTDAAALEGAATLVINYPGSSVPNPFYRNTAGFSSNGPRYGDSTQKPEISAPGVAVLSAGVGTGSGSATISGTSMAAPNTSGVAALVKQAHPTWTSNQIKAALMSTASSSLIGDFDSRRNGTGVVQAREAVDTVAYITTSDFKNTVSFGAVGIPSSYSESRPFTITNTGTTDITYHFAVQGSSPPWGSVSVSPAAVTVKKGKSATVQVIVKLSVGQTQALPTAYLSDFGDLTTLNGLIVATPAAPGPGIYPLSIPYMMVPKGLSDIQPKSASTKVTGGLTQLITLNNKGKHDGYFDIYAAALVDSSSDVSSKSSVLNLTSVGVQTLDLSFIDPVLDHTMIFAINSSTQSSTQSIHEADLWFDTNGDTIPDYVSIAIDAGLWTTGSPNGVMGTFTYSLLWFLGIPFLDVQTEAWSGISAPANSSLIFPIVSSDALGLSDPGLVSFTVQGYSVLESLPGDSIPGPWATYDPFNEVVETGGFGFILAGGTASGVLQVDTSQLANQSPRGWTFVSVDDLWGNKSAQTIKIVGPIT